MERHVFLLLLAVLLAWSELVPVEYLHACTDERRPELYGFPAIQRTGVPWVNSMCGVRYVDGTVANVLFFYTLLLAGRWALGRIGFQQDRGLPRWLPWMVLLPFFSPLALDFLAVDWSWQWSSDWDMACFKAHWEFNWRYR